MSPSLGECLLYPLTDGPGLGLLVFLPPFLWLLSLPIFDVISVLQPLTKGDWALGLLVVPVMIPVLFSFAMIFGYALLFLGQCWSSSSLGENDHPALAGVASQPTSRRGSAAGSGRACSASRSAAARWCSTGCTAATSTGSTGSSSPS